MFTRYYNILNYDEQQTCLNILEQPKWAFSGKSNDDSTFRFWFRELITEDFFTDLVFNRICKITKKMFIIKRVYANGQTPGLPGELHIDDPSTDKHYTFLYYANLNWDVQWGGSTIFYKDENEFTTAHFIPNTGILFKSNILHVGLDPTVHFKGLRMTVAFKLKEI